MVLCVVAAELVVVRHQLLASVTVNVTRVEHFPVIQPGVPLCVQAQNNNLFMFRQNLQIHNVLIPVWSTLFAYATMTLASHAQCVRQPPVVDRNEPIVYLGKQWVYDLVAHIAGHARRMEITPAHLHHVFLSLEEIATRIAWYALQMTKISIK
jgi:hypothetical protein